eukprot:UC4_evm2s1127
MDPFNVRPYHENPPPNLRIQSQSQQVKSTSASHSPRAPGSGRSPLAAGRGPIVGPAPGIGSLMGGGIGQDLHQQHNGGVIVGGIGSLSSPSGDQTAIGLDMKLRTPSENKHHPHHASASSLDMRQLRLEIQNLDARMRSAEERHRRETEHLRHIITQQEGKLAFILDAFTSLDARLQQVHQQNQQQGQQLSAFRHQQVPLHGNGLLGQTTTSALNTVSPSTVRTSQSDITTNSPQPQSSFAQITSQKRDIVQISGANLGHIDLNGMYVRDGPRSYNLDNRIFLAFNTAYNCWAISSSRDPTVIPYAHSVTEDSISMGNSPSCDLHSPVGINAWVIQNGPQKGASDSGQTAGDWLPFKGIVISLTSPEDSLESSGSPSALFEIKNYGEQPRKSDTPASFWSKLNMDSSQQTEHTDDRQYNGQDSADYSSQSQHPSSTSKAHPEAEAIEFMVQILNQAGHPLDTGEACARLYKNPRVKTILHKSGGGGKDFFMRHSEIFLYMPPAGTSGGGSKVWLQKPNPSSVKHDYSVKQTSQHTYRSRSYDEHNVTVVVNDVPTNCTPDALRRSIETIAAVKRGGIDIKSQRSSSRPGGFYYYAFVELTSVEGRDKVLAAQARDGFQINGHKLRIEPKNGGQPKRQSNLGHK